MSSYCIKGGPKSNDWCLNKERELWRYTEIQRRQGVRPSEDRGRNWSYAATNEGRLGIAMSHQKLKEARMDFPLQSFKGAWPCQQLDFGLLT